MSANPKKLRNTMARTGNHTIMKAVLIVTLVCASGCGTVSVTSAPPGAMIFRSFQYPADGEIERITEMAGNAPCSWIKNAQAPAAKARWPDGSESEWMIADRDQFGSKDVSFHFEKSKASIPETGTHIWSPFGGTHGYVEFYVSGGRPPRAFRICAQYGTEFCLINRGSLKKEGSRLRLECQPGANVFVIILGNDERHIGVDIKADHVAKVRIDYKEIGKRSRQLSGGSYEEITDFNVELTVESEEALNKK